MAKKKKRPQGGTPAKGNAPQPGGAVTKGGAPSPVDSGVKAAAPPPAAAMASPTLLPAVMTRLRLILVVLAAAGLGISIYLTTVHYTPVPLVCFGGVEGCEEVNRSIYSEIAGVSVALLGAGGYLAILLALWAENQRILKDDEAAVAVFGFSLAGFLYSVYLTYVEVAILQAICSWCVFSAILMTAIFGISIYRLRDRLTSYQVSR